MANKKPIGVFTKDGNEKTAWTPAEAVALKFQGWTEKKAAKSTSSTSSGDTKSTSTKTASTK